MPIDPNLALQVRSPQVEGPLEMYTKAMSLRGMMDERRYRQAQLERLQFEQAKDLREQADEMAFRQALPGLGEDAPLSKLAQFGKRGLDYATAVRLAQKAGTEQATAKIDLTGKQAEMMANDIMAVYSLPKEQQQAAYAALHPKYVALGLRKPTDPIEPMPSEEQAHEAAIRGYGYAKWREIEDKKAEETRKAEGEKRAKTEEGRKDYKHQMEVAESALGGVQSQGDWDRFLPLLPKEIRAQVGEMFSPTAAGRAKLFFLTEQQRQAAGVQAQTEARLQKPTNLDQLIIWKNQRGRTPDELAWANQAEKQMLQAHIATASAGANVLYTPAKLAQLKDLRERAEVNGLSVPQFTQIQTLARAFDSSKAVKDFQEINDKYKSVVSILNKPSLGGPGDLAFVYEAMHGIEPGSVVRTEEFKNFADSGNIFQGAFARFNGYLKPNGGFLPPGVKQAFMEMLKQKVASHGQSIHKVYQDLGRRIDLITGQLGTGQQYLTDYSGVLGEDISGGKPDLSGSSTDELLKKLMEKRK